MGNVVAPTDFLFSARFLRRGGCLWASILVCLSIGPFLLACLWASILAHGHPFLAHGHPFSPIGSPFSSVLFFSHGIGTDTAA